MAVDAENDLIRKVGLSRIFHSVPSFTCMPRRAISRDVKIAAIRLYERQLLDLPDIIECCGISERTWYRILKLWRTAGDVVSESTSLRGRLRILNHEDIRYLKFLIHQNPDYFLDELLHLLKTNRFVSLHYTTIHHELEHARVSRKRLQRVAMERNEDRRADFIRRMAYYSPEELGFIDEVSRDERTLGRHYGRAGKGCRARKKQPFVRGRRTSTVGVLSLDGFVARSTVEGSFTKVLFLDWLEHDVVCSAFSCPTAYSPSTAPQVQRLSRPVECPGARQCEDPSRRRDLRACRSFRRSHRVPTALFARSQPHRGGLQQDQALPSSASRVLLHQSRRRGARFDLRHVRSVRYCYCRRCSWIFCPCGLFLVTTDYSLSFSLPMSPTLLYSRLLSRSRWSGRDLSRLRLSLCCLS
jgi:hypothetical protein